MKALRVLALSVGCMAFEASAVDENSCPPKINLSDLVLKSLGTPSSEAQYFSNINQISKDELLDRYGTQVEVVAQLTGQLDLEENASPANDHTCRYRFQGQAHAVRINRSSGGILEFLEPVELKAQAKLEGQNSRASLNLVTDYKPQTEASEFAGEGNVYLALKLDRLNLKTCATLARSIGGRQYQYARSQDSTAYLTTARVRVSTLCLSE